MGADINYKSEKRKELSRKIMVVGTFIALALGSLITPFILRQRHTILWKLEYDPGLFGRYIAFVPIFVGILVVGYYSIKALNMDWFKEFSQKYYKITFVSFVIIVIITTITQSLVYLEWNWLRDTVHAYPWTHQTIERSWHSLWQDIDWVLRNRENRLFAGIDHPAYGISDDSLSLTVLLTVSGVFLGTAFILFRNKLMGNLKSRVFLYLPWVLMVFPFLIFELAVLYWAMVYAGRLRHPAPDGIMRFPFF